MAGCAVHHQLEQLGIYRELVQPHHITDSSTRHRECSQRQIKFLATKHGPGNVKKQLCQWGVDGWEQSFLKCEGEGINTHMILNHNWRHWHELMFSTLET